MTPPHNPSALQIQIDSLGGQMKQGFDEIKQMLRDYEERTRTLETREAGCQPIIHARIDALTQDVAEQNTRLATKSQQINTLETNVTKLAEQIKQVLGIYKSMQKFYLAIAIPFFLAVGGFILALITHQAMVVFK